MVNRYQEIVKQFNVRKQKPRYRLKRERRHYLTEAFIDGELALYKPTHIPYKLFTDKIMKSYPDIHKEEPVTTSSNDGGYDVTIDKDTVTFSPHKPETVEKETKLTLWQRIKKEIKRWLPLRTK